jgi:hypothetical protein
MSKSFNLIDNASTALIPVEAKSITYVFNLISEQPFKILTMSFLSIASLFLLISFGNLTFILNFRGLISISLNSKKFFAVTTSCLSVDVWILESCKYTQ